MSTSRILDTSALLAWPTEKLSGCRVAASQKAELAKVSEQRSLLIDSAQLEWCTPTPAGVKAARAAAVDSGDLPRLSAVDIDLIALSFDFADAVLYTDDYRIQNTLSRANREWKVVQQAGISAEWLWMLRCTGCGRQTSNDGGEASNCDYCGSPQRLKRKRV